MKGEKDGWNDSCADSFGLFSITISPHAHSSSPVLTSIVCFSVKSITPVINIARRHSCPAIEVPRPGWKPVKKDSVQARMTRQKMWKYIAELKQSTGIATLFCRIKEGGLI